MTRIVKPSPKAEHYPLSCTAPSKAKISTKIWRDPFQRSWRAVNMSIPLSCTTSSPTRSMNMWIWWASGTPTWRAPKRTASTWWAAGGRKWGDNDTFSKFEPSCWNWACGLTKSPVVSPHLGIPTVRRLPRFPSQYLGTPRVPLLRSQTQESY